MNYDITFTDDGERALTRLEAEAQERVTQKLRQIATSEYRHPTDWDFKRMAGCAEGRFAVADGIRVFADIDESTKTIRIHTVGRRENLYT